MAATKSKADGSATASAPVAQQRPAGDPTHDQHDPDIGDDIGDENGSIAAAYPPEVPRWAYVTDTTAVRRAREHDIDGRKYRFQPGAETKMPIEDGLRLVNIDSFIVRDEHGNIYRPAQTEVAPGASELNLRNDQVIASLHELQIGALRDRAARWDEHPDYDARAPREALIAFMMERLAEGAPRPRGPRPTSRRAAADPWDFTGNPDGLAGPVSQADIAAALAAQRESSAVTSRLGGGYGSAG